MAISVVSNYGNSYENIYSSKNKEKEVSGKNTYETGNTSVSKEDSNQEYLKKLQNKVSYVELETGFGLSTKRDNKMGTITINPKLLDKMQNNSEEENKYTQMIKDIERAEKTATSFYNALGGCVERTSHWYIDENGKYYHFAYTRRDDKLNKKLREEEKKNAEKQIEVTRKNAREKAKGLEEKLAKKAEENKKKSQEQKSFAKNPDSVNSLKEKAEKKPTDTEQAGANLDVKI